MSKGDELARPQRVIRGVSFIVAAMFVTSVQDVIFKFFSNELTLGQIFALRGLLALPLLIALAWIAGLRGGVLADALEKWTLLRSLFMTLCFLAFYTAIPFLSLSTVGAANFIAPIFVTLLTAYVVGESVGIRRWIGVFMGFAGVLVLLQPGTDAFSPMAILPLFGALFYALSHITTRTKCQSVPLPTMALTLNLVMLTAGLIVSGVVMIWQPGDDLVRAYPSVLGGWVAPSFTEWLVLGLLAVLAIVISSGIAGAYQIASPPIIATFEYSYLVFVALWDILFFDTTPSAMTLLGMVLIIGAGLKVIRRR